ncbi:hypothetical protein GALMADRAFT_230871 [Galerina marginata CBS 339.88]|uniref:Uncharacterized protein n=1 Tax=Galerina marginata (strain CBS 339.88) TaxID=685588 RepID=A0A067SDU0_GALM3|nr:hypothetical protein GALMADRAFT_230871 [Galerina marginata CBS 339.88]
MNGLEPTIEFFLNSPLWSFLFPVLFLCVVVLWIYVQKSLHALTQYWQLPDHHYVGFGWPRESTTVVNGGISADFVDSSWRF